MSELIKKSSGSLTKHDGVLDTLSDGMIFAGLGMVPIWLTAALLPGGMLIWAFLYVVAGATLGALANKS